MEYREIKKGGDRVVAPLFLCVGQLVHLLECPKKKDKVKCQSKDGYQSFILFHNGRVAIGFVATIL